MWFNIDCPQLMSRFDRYQLQLVYLAVEHHPRSLQHKTLQTTFDTFNQTWHLLRTQIFFCILVALLPFLK